MQFLKFSFATKNTAYIELKPLNKYSRAIWRRKRDSNPRAFWANGFQDRLVVTASIFLRIIV